MDSKITVVQLIPYHYIVFEDNSLSCNTDWVVFFGEPVLPNFEKPIFVSPKVSNIGAHYKSAVYFAYQIVFTKWFEGSATKIHMEKWYCYNDI